jgi:hypothetical protein
VAVVQNTFTHKQYTAYRERSIHNNKKKIGSAFCAPSLRVIPWHCLTTEEKAWKNLRLVAKCPDILAAVVQYTFTYKQCGKIL